MTKQKASTDVIVVISAGLIGQTIARRLSHGKHVLLAYQYNYNVLQHKNRLCASIFQFCRNRSNHLIFLRD